MAPLGPFGPSRRVAVAVSGGADSMALAVLASAWGRVSALIVDHGLRPDSAHEAQVTQDRLAARGIAARIVTLTHLHSGPGIPARARAARYAALTEACRQDGLVDLLLGHHAADQAETVTMRREAGSGPAGLAGMAAIGVTGPVRLLRPLLSVPPVRLRATLAAAGVAWVEDPTNGDLRFTRARIRAAMPNLPPQTHAGAARHVREAGAWPGTIAVHPAGFATLTGAACREALAAAIWTVSGRSYPPSPGAVDRAMGAATLHGVRIVPHRGRRHVIREEPSVPPIEAREGAVWDGRFRVDRCDEPGLHLGRLGDDAARLRDRSALPSAVLRTFPVLRRNGVLWAVPHLAYPSAMVCASVRIAFRPARPIVGSPFVPSADPSGVNMPPLAPMCALDGCTPEPDGGSGPQRPRTVMQ